MFNDLENLDDLKKEEKKVMQVQGIVERMSQRQAGRGTAYNICVNGEWYGCGFKQPPCSQGDTISFVETVNARGYKEVVANSMQVLGGGNGAPPQQQQPRQQGAYQQRAPAQAPQRGMTKDKYWENKEERDLTVQKAIQYQASRNAAIQVVDVALKNEAVKLPAAQNKKMDAIVALVSELTDRLNQDVTDFVEGRKNGAAPSDDGNYEADQGYDEFAE